MKGNLLRAVRSHLARPAAGAIAEHPDANLLAAFAEKALSERERTAVARHLAHCADCRKMLALAFAQEEEPLAAPARPARRWSPMWSWAASTAALCIVCSAVWEYRLQRGTVAPPPSPPAPSVAHATEPASPAPPTSTTTAPKAVAAAPRTFKPPVPQPASPRQVEAPPPPPPLAEAAPAPTDSLRRVQARTAPPPPYYQSPGVQAQALQRPSQQWAAQARQSTPTPMAAASGFTMARPAIAGTARAKRAPRADTVAPHPLWTIASEDLAGGHPRGIVQRSLDEGATWQTVSIDDNVSFRAIASNGAEVWAGGDGGALFRSTDSGGHWERIAFPMPIITAIRIGANGEIHVTAGQDWVTRDGGVWTTD